MRKGGGKAKGGAHELAIIRKLAVAFKSLGIQEDDCFRTKNSGATKSQPGDIQLSPRFAKMFPVLIECKHYSNVKYKLGKHLHALPKSYPLRQWWKQVKDEQKALPSRLALLIFRQNNCPDIICLKIDHFNTLCGSNPDWKMFSWSMFTMWKNESLIMLPFDEFIACCVNKIKRLRNARNK